MLKQNSLLRLLNRFAPGSRTQRKHLLCRKQDFDEFTCRWGNTVSLTADGIRRILKNADDGAPGEMALLFRQMLENEPGITAHIQTRFLAVLSCGWQIDGDDRKKSEEVRRILESANFHGLLEHLISAEAYGYAGAGIVWGEGGGTITAFQPVAPMNFLFDRCGNPALMTLDGEERSLASYHENQFVFYRTGLPLLRPLVWLYLFKHHAMRDRAKYLERFGIPFIAAKIRNEDFESDEIRNELMQSLAKLGSDGVGLLNEGAEVQIVHAAGSAANDYQAWMEYLDTLATRLILGQTATSSAGTGFSSGSVQDKVRRDLLEADCRALETVVNRDILAPLERFRFGTEQTLRFRMDYAVPVNLQEKAEIVSKLTGAGFRISPEWVEKTFSLPLNQ